VATRLLQIVPFTNVAPSATVVLPHNINVNGTPKKPDFVATDVGGFTITVTATTVSVTNTGTDPASPNIWLELKHTTPRQLGNDVDNLTPQPFVVASSGGGGGGGGNTGQRFVYVANGTEQDTGFVVPLPANQPQPYLVWAQMEGFPAYGPYMTFDVPTGTMTPTQFTVIPSDILEAGDQIAFYVDSVTS
jgi:hypothetical protein